MEISTYALLRCRLCIQVFVVATDITTAAELDVAGVDVGYPEAAVEGVIRRGPRVTARIVAMGHEVIPIALVGTVVSAARRQDDRGEETNASGEIVRNPYETLGRCAPASRPAADRR